MSGNRQRYVETQQLLIAELAELWPQCFVVYARRRKPLKVGIRDDLVAYGYAKEAVGAALRCYTASSGYLWALKPGSPRVDLDGQAAGVVSNSDAAFASELLAKRRERKEARRQQQAAEAAQSAKAAAFASLRAAAAARKARAA
jgi:ProP effector